jgi:hypothetical protein
MSTMRGASPNSVSARPQDLGDAEDKGGGKPAPAVVRVHEQVFQVDHAAGFGPGGEADHRAVLFGDMSAAFG